MYSAWRIIDLFEFVVSEEWFIGICGAGMQDFNLRFSQVRGVEQVAVRCMCSENTRVISQQEVVGQGAHCIHWFLF